MHGQLIAYRANLWAVILNGLMMGLGFVIPWVALVCIVINVSLATYHKSLYEKRKAPVIESPQTTAEMCSLWEIRRTQLKMLDAGIIEDEDISTCSDEQCPPCSATRETKARNARKQMIIDRDAKIRAERENQSIEQRWEEEVIRADGRVIHSFGVPSPVVHPRRSAYAPPTARLKMKNDSKELDAARINMIDARKKNPIPPKGPGGVVTRRGHNICSDPAAHQLTGGCSCYMRAL